MTDAKKGDYNEVTPGSSLRVQLLLKNPGADKDNGDGSSIGLSASLVREWLRVRGSSVAPCLRGLYNTKIGCWLSTYFMLIIES
jgi:hypothetical protein